MHRILCSTGALIGRPNGRNYRLLTACADRLSCDGFEFMMYESWYGQLPELRAFLIEASLPVPVFHCDKMVGNLISRNGPGDMDEANRRFAANCELAALMGADRMVLHLWGGLDSDRDMAHTVSCYPMLLRIAESQGVLLTIENVVCNQADPMTHLRTLTTTYPDIAFTFDTKMAAFHSQLECLYDPENAHLFPHIRHIHVNDYAGGHQNWSALATLHMGDGHINFDRFFAYIREQNYQGDFTVEATSFDETGAIDDEKLNATFHRLRRFLMAV